MTPIILESPTPPSPSPAVGVDRESLILDGLDLNDGGTRRVVGLEFTAAKKLLEWIKGADADGAKLLRLARYDNSEFDFRLYIQNSSRDLVLDTIGGIIDKLQEAERIAAGARGRGLELVWSPMGTSYSYTFYVLAGETNLDRAHDFYKLGKPFLEVKLYTSPFGYGPEVTTSTTTSSLSLVTKTITDVPGDVPAEFRLIVTDAAGHPRDFMAVGGENYYYGAGPDLVTLSLYGAPTYAGVSTTRTGSVNSGVMRGTLMGSPVVVCASGELTHKGTFRNFFRLWSSSTNVSVRMSWRQGRDQWTTEPWVQAPFEDAWWEPDLGECRIREAPLGTQSWQWRLEATTTTPGDTVDVDVHEMIPTEIGFNKARNSRPFETPQIFSAYDDFGGGSGPLDANNMATGGTWSGAGDADDFTVTSGVAYRDAASDTSMVGRFAVAGTTVLTNTVVQADIKVDSADPLVSQYLGVVARYTSATNAAVLRVTPSDGTVQLVQWSAGPATSSLSSPLATGPMLIDTWYRLRLLVTTEGKFSVWFGQGTEPPLVMSGVQTSLATGGALASGKVGLYDEHASVGTHPRYYHHFVAFVPVIDAVCFASQSVEFRSYGDDPALREDSTGTYWGRPPEVRGGRMWLPPAGTVDRTTRIAVLARRADIETTAATNATDSTSVTVAYTPRWVNVPRQG